MNSKNLHLKFAFIALLIAACIFALKEKGIKLGIDLRGGYSLTYEMRDKAISASDMAESISVLKNRVDPNGLAALEWTPLGGNQFEVRMPAAGHEAATARAAFEKVMDEIQRGNLQRRAILDVIETPPAQRPAAIEAATANPLQRQRLAEVAAAHDAMKAAAAGSDEAARFSAADDYDRKYEQLLKTNVSPQHLQTILGGYISPNQEKSMLKGGRTAEEIDELRKTYEARYNDFLEGRSRYDVESATTKPQSLRSPQQQKLIAAARETYEAWSRARRTLDDPSDLKRLIAKAGVLEFRMAPPAGSLSPADLEHYQALLRDNNPAELATRGGQYLWMEVVGDRDNVGGLILGNRDGKTYVLLSNKIDDVLLKTSGDWKLADARRGSDQAGRPAVNFSFDAVGAKLFGDLTARHINDRMAILLDDQVYSAPTIKSAISESGQITGKFTPAETQELAKVMKAGSLPARLNPNPISESSFGPSLGEENLKAGLKAGLYGLIAIAVFMMVYYFVGGFIANAALMLNIVLVLGAMSLLDAVFTMPGIAGVILSIGMGVDSNVLIQERLREEQERKLPLRQALKNAYDRAFSAIFDSHVTTLLTCAILYWVGTEEIKGFAIALGLGVAFNLFTAVLVTRWVVQLLLKARVLKDHLRMLHLVRLPHIDWMGKRYWFWGFSAVMMVLGVASLIWQGSNIWGIEFSGGTRVTVNFRADALIDGKLPNDGLVAAKFRSEADKLGDTIIRDTARVEKRLDPQQAGSLLRERDADHDGKITLKEWTDSGLSGKYFEMIDADKNGSLDLAELEKNLPTRSYQISTSEHDLDKIRLVLRDAFGGSLESHEKLTYKLLAGDEAPGLRVMTTSDGRTPISRSLIDRAAEQYRSALREFEGGAMFVIDDIKPSISPAELFQRLREVRLQVQFAAGQFSPTEVVGLKPADQPGRYTAVAVLVSQADQAGGAAGADSTEWKNFAEGQQAAVKAALEREEAITAQTFSPSIAGQQANLAIVAVVLSWLGIIAYLWVRFGSFQWGLAAVICLVHDTLVVTGLVAASGWLSNYLGFLGVESFKIDLAMVAALLTLIGYSVSDTIIVFDRIRENRGKLKAVTPAIINLSVNQTISRTLITSGTVLVVVLAMYIWGGEGIHGFNFAFLFGVLFGTYSSVAVAAPLLLGFKGAVLKRAAPAEPQPAPAAK
jgi:SecD/SecF fusion protein